MCVRSGLEPTAAYMSEPISSVYGLSLHRVGKSFIFIRFLFVNNRMCIGFTEFILKYVSTLYIYSPCNRCMLLLPLFLYTLRPIIHLIELRSLHRNLKLISYLAVSIICLFRARIAILSMCTARIIKSYPVVYMYVQ